MRSVAAALGAGFVFGMLAGGAVMAGSVRVDTRRVHSLQRGLDTCMQELAFAQDRAEDAHQERHAPTRGKR